MLLATVVTGCSAVVPKLSPPGPGASSVAAASPSPSPTLLPDPAVLKAGLAAVPAKGIGQRGEVVLADDGTVLAGTGAERLLAPASTLKVLTTLASVDILGADHTFATRVVSAASGRLVLVGGGDPLLTDKASGSAAKPASLQRLASQTVTALKAAGVKRISLGYDASAFSGPDFSPDWKASWKSYEARVSALVVDSGRFNPWQAQPNPALAAANAFATRLRAARITVTSVRAATAPADAQQLAAVTSAPLATIIAHTLAYSDNLAADMLARQAAIASGAAGSFTGAAATVRQWLAVHGLWQSGMVIVDGSGLAEKDRVSATVLARAINLSLHTDGLAAVAAGLPVAGVNGTLKNRFNDASEKAGRGVVHAKTGTLSDVAGLAGYLTSADGARLVFAFLGNDTAGQTSAYNWLDRSAAVLAGCGCR